MGRVIGIDLGTTFSTAAWVNEHGKPEILPNAESERLTPSVILFDEDAVVVGKVAKQQLVSDPDQVVSFVKRRMGQSVDQYHHEWDGVEYSAEMLSAIILKKIKRDAESALGEDVSSAVITVPAYFGDAERAATRNAGRIAGLDVIELLNEPTAAAIAYGIDKLGSDQRVFVFDLGGGTLDVTLMEVSGSEIRMIQTNGSGELGGKDWDEAVVQHVARRFRAEHGLDVKDDPDGAERQLWQDAAAAKEALSSRPKTSVMCGSAGRTTRVELTRVEFEDLTAAWLRDCEELCGVVLRDAGMTWDDIDRVLLAGGSTRMPQVRDMLGRLSGKSIDPSDVNPDEVVALGAAIKAVLRQPGDHGAESGRAAEALMARYGVTEIAIIDGATQSLGAVVRERETGTLKNRVLIEKMTPVPCEAQETFVTVSANQRSALVRVLEGLPNGKREESGVDFSTYQIGEVRLNLPSGLPMHSPVAVTYRYGLDQILEVVARGPDGRVAKTTIDRRILDGDAVARASTHLEGIIIE